MTARNEGTKTARSAMTSTPITTTPAITDARMIHQVLHLSLLMVKMAERDDPLDGEEEEEDRTDTLLQLPFKSSESRVSDTWT